MSAWLYVHLNILLNFVTVFALGTRITCFEFRGHLLIQHIVTFGYSLGCGRGSWHLGCFCFYSGYWLGSFLRLAKVR